VKEELFSHIHLAEAIDLTRVAPYASTTRASPFLSLDLFWVPNLLLPLNRCKMFSFIGKGMLIPIYCAAAQTR